MAALIAIGYPDETTALAAMEEVGQLERDLVIQPDTVAAIVRNREGAAGHHQPPLGRGLSAAAPPGPGRRRRG